MSASMLVEAIFMKSLWMLFERLKMEAQKGLEVETGSIVTRMICTIDLCAAASTRKRNRQAT